MKAQPKRVPDHREWETPRYLHIDLTTQIIHRDLAIVDEFDSYASSTALLDLLLHLLPHPPLICANYSLNLPGSIRCVLH